MVSKRYTPKYKNLLKLRRVLWLERRRKLKVFDRSKWEPLKRMYATRKLRKLRTFRQDSSTYKLGIEYETRLKKTYLFLLHDKQAFQLYYGLGRLNLTRLKSNVLLARDFGLQRNVSSARVLHHVMESRLDVLLYRLFFVGSLMQSRKLFSSDSVVVSGYKVKNLSFYLYSGSLVNIESMMVSIIMTYYLKSQALFFYYGKRLSRKLYIHKKIKILTESFFSLERQNFGFFFVCTFLTYRFYFLQAKVREFFVVGAAFKTYKKNFFKSFFYNKCFYLVLVPKVKVVDFFSVDLKTYVYGLFKILQFCRFSIFLDFFGWLFQYNGFYLDIAEFNKEVSINVVKSKIDNVQGYGSIFFNSVPRKIKIRKLQDSSLGDLSKGFALYEDFFFTQSTSSSRFLLKVLKKEVISKFLFFRLFPFLLDVGRRNLFSYDFFLKRKRKLSLLFRFYPRNVLKFYNTVKRRKVVLKKLIWKMLKRRKWHRKKWGLLGKLLFFRSQRRFSKLFYFPRNVEVNLKTFAVYYLGYTDFNTVNSRIYFWLNLRRLLTFLLR